MSDIHGNLPALEAVVADMRRRGVDQVANLGDSLSGPLLPRETAAFLMDQDWIHLAGNHERQLLTLGPENWCASDAYAYGQLGEAELSWLASLPAQAKLADEILLCHGTPCSDIEYLVETVEPGLVRGATLTELDQRLGSIDAALVACGHSHVPRATRAGSGRWVVNPGSVGLQAYSDDRPYHHAMESGSPDARYAIVEKVSGVWMVSLLTVPYRHELMASLARERNRPDWAHALLTGRVGG